MQILRQLLLGLALLALSFQSFSANVALDTLTNPAGMTTARISPDGKHIAAILFDGTTHSVVLADAEKLEFELFTGPKTEVDGFYIFKRQPNSLLWLSNDLLAVNFEKGAFAFRVDGKSPVPTMDHTRTLITLVKQPVANLGERVIKLVDGPEPGRPHVLSYTNLDDGSVALIDASTGIRQRFRFPSGEPLQIAYDRHGHPRAVTMIDSSFWQGNTRVSNWYRPAPDIPWQKLAEFKITDDYWTPNYVQDDSTLIISARHGRDTNAIFAFDPKQRSVGELLAGHASEDIVSVEGLDKEAFSRVSTYGMKQKQFWFDPVWHRLQAGIDAALPGRINILRGNPEHRILIHSYSDVDPGTWYVLDVPKSTLQQFGKSRNAIDPSQMRPMSTISFRANDGMSIPAYLTLPEGAAKGLPTVVLIHGGPAIRDAWQWALEVQFLANRGYAVLQPQFRGSSGFGLKFEQAGYGQWGLRMQDDISAGVEHLVRQGIADPKRICIYGSSYGGYAALWGLVKTPHLFKCGIGFAGPSDLELLFTDKSDRNKSKATRELQRFRIGDLATSRQQLHDVSPVHFAERIQAPVLLAHGLKDERVPVEHSLRMLTALKANGKQVEWLPFDDEGHGLHFIKNERRMLEEVEAFLARHLGSNKTAPSP
jgi:dienelactone hydrolase